jgi:hypothetical protein
MRYPIILAIVALVLAATDVAAQQTSPALRYTPPPNAYKSAAMPPEDYSFNGFNASASVQVYPFRPLTGDIQRTFRATLLRDWITPMHQEERIAGQPTFQTISVPGAQFALTASFVDSPVGLPKPHLRMLVVAGGQAAIVDASAGTAQSWQSAIPALNAMAATLRVEAARAPPPLSRSAGSAVAGLFQGMKQKYMASMNNIIGRNGYYTNALHYYLFSADGRVYCAYDKLEVPGGNVARFDFDAAERRDPTNSGRYTVDGDKLIIQMGGAAPQTIVTGVPRDGMVTINTVLYKRQ